MKKKTDLVVSGDQELLNCLYRSQAILEGHFLLSSGNHSSYYLQCALLMSHPQEALYAAQKVAELIKEKYSQVDAIVSPALGGMLIGYQVAMLLQIRNFFIERKDKKMTIGRGFQFEKGEKVVIVEDVVTTGKSVLEVKECLEEKDVQVQGIASIIQRLGDHQFNHEIASPLKVSLPCYSTEECPLCQEKIAITQLGSRTF